MSNDINLRQDFSDPSYLSHGPSPFGVGGSSASEGGVSKFLGGMAVEVAKAAGTIGAATLLRGRFRLIAQHWLRTLGDVQGTRTGIGDLAIAKRGVELPRTLQDIALSGCVYAVGLNRSIHALPIETMIGDVVGQRDLRQTPLTRAEKARVVHEIRENVEQGGMVAGALLVALIGWSLDKSAKRDDVKATINEYAQGVLSEIEQLRDQHVANQAEREAMVSKSVETIEAHIAGLPEAEQKEVRAELEEFIAILHIENEKLNAVIEGVVDKLRGELSLYSTSESVGAKDFISQLGAALIGVAIAIESKNLPIAKKMVQALADTAVLKHIGLSKKFIEVLLMGTVVAIVQESVKAALTQNVTKKEVEALSQQLLRELDIDPDHPAAPLSEKEHKLSKEAGSVLAKSVGKLIGLVWGKGAEVAVVAFVKPASGGLVDKHVGLEEKDEVVKKSFQSTTEQIRALGGEAEGSLLQEQEFWNEMVKSVHERRI